ncbi:MAG: ribose-phosphate pyrophosphokinase [Gemmatimonadaceae bacterium]|nr:ribose-phosphate pyrophosphokinase [Gemmatimonadaceae bacterium]
MTPIVLALPGNEVLAASLVSRPGAESGLIELRRFPDGETYVRLETPVRDREVILACTLERPDDKLIRLLFLAAAARDLGAARIGLVAPYLAYMRQDRRFREGEGVTSSYFARIVSANIDWLVTVDPHLHRRSSLAEIYSIGTDVVHAAPRVAEWIKANVEQPLLVGPDAESAQWVQDVAALADAPSVVLQKTRHGDREVAVSIPDVDRWRDHTPVLVDDIISTARTMIETVGHLRRSGLRPATCIGVHAVFADDAYRQLQAAGPAQIVTCNTIPHPSNAIDLHDILAERVSNLMSPHATRSESPGRD